MESLQNVEPGDCIVCFNKQDIYSVSRGLERLGKEAAVIYGSLPPNTKLAMSQRFNDPEVSERNLKYFQWFKIHHNFYLTFI